jgi:hypothetical protein
MAPKSGGFEQERARGGLARPGGPVLFAGLACFGGRFCKDWVMALKATIYKAQLELADMDRQLYTEHSITMARHPSETDERMLIRLLAFARGA